MRLPHSPVLESTDNTQYKDLYKQRMDAWREMTREQAILAHRNSPEYNSVDKYIRYLEGNQWDNRRARYKSKFIQNKLELARREKLALLTDSRPVIDISSTVSAFEESALMLHNLAISEWQRQNLSEELVNVVDIAMLHGTGYWRIGASHPGKTRIQSLGPDCVIPIQPSLNGIQDAVAVLCRTYKPIPYIKKVFPYTSQGVEQQAQYWNSSKGDSYMRPMHIPEQTWTQMSPAFRKIVGTPQPPISSVGVQSYGSVSLEEYFVEDNSINESTRTIVMRDPFLTLDQHNWWYEVKPGERLYPRKRLVVYAGDKLLYDGPSNFWHGLYPFVDLRLNPVPWNYYGFSTYRPLLPIQEAINSIPAGLLDMTARALNPVMIAKSNVASPAAWKEFLSDRPGAQLKVNPNVRISEDIQYADIPQIPSYVPELLGKYLLPEFDKMSGIVDISAISGKKQIPAGDTLAQMQDSLQTPLRREERYIEGFLSKAGQQFVSNACQFYTMEQRLKLLGEDGITSQDFAFDPAKLTPKTLDKEMKESFWKCFSITVKPGSLHSGAKDREKAEAIGLAARGLLSRRELFRVLGFDPGRADRIMMELQEEAQAIASMQGGAGGSRTPRDPEIKEKGVAPMG
jgi:hypothetical protein